MPTKEFINLLIIKPIPGWPGYFLGNDGLPRSNRVRVKNPGGSTGFSWIASEQLYVLSPMKRRSGHLSIGLHKDGRVHRLLIHMLVLETFVGPRPEGMQCRHLNGVPSDNRPENLAWGTVSENARDKATHGTAQRGIKSGMSKLTEENVKEIRKLRGEGWKIAVLGKRFGVTDVNISYICKRMTWVHVT